MAAASEPSDAVGNSLSSKDTSEVNNDVSSIASVANVATLGKRLSRRSVKPITPVLKRRSSAPGEAPRINQALKGTVTHNLPPEAMGSRRGSADAFVLPRKHRENQVGDKIIRVIPDSGSFDLYLIDQGACSKGLGLCSRAYNSKESNTHTCPSSEVIKDVVFGSGTARCRLGFDKAELVNDAEVAAAASATATTSDHTKPSSLVRQEPPKVLFPLWQIFALDEGLLRIWGDGQGFQGILGMGYKAGEDVSPDEAIKQLNATEGVSAVTGISTLAPGEGASELFTDRFAICLPRGSRAKKLVLAETANRLRNNQKTTMSLAADGDRSKPEESDSSDDKGMLWWGQAIPRSRKFAITTPVIGVRHWTIDVKGIEVVDSSKKDSTPLTSFCDKSSCAALVDSGTSLFALPAPRVKQIFASLGDLKLDCSNVQDLPDIKYHSDMKRFGNFVARRIAIGDSKQPLVITPESYVMKIQSHDIHLYESLGQSLMLGGNLDQFKKNAGPNITLCLPAFMSSPVSQGTVRDLPSFTETNDHLTEMMILGIPIFREYTVLFDRDRSTIGFDRNPEDGPSCGAAAAAAASTSLIHRGYANGGRPLTIREMPRPEHLVFPSGLDSIRKMAPPVSGAVIGSEMIL